MTRAEQIDALERLWKGRAMNLNNELTTISDVIYKIWAGPRPDETEACLLVAWVLEKGRATRPYAEIVATTRPMVGQSHADSALAAVEASCL